MKKGAIFTDKSLRQAKEVMKRDMSMHDALEEGAITLTRFEALLLIRAVKQSETAKTQAYYRLKNFANKV